ncbi:hypothetical protein GGR52DRAFT_574004 [Hypoxylon sp. FL1284]|nr:hypothetical protein GGR52DRAFT_574004 [Hypoxylon sp. FL1284]
MTSDVNISRRPNLEPIWTNYRFGGMPKTAVRSAPLINSGLSPSALSPRSLPSPNPVHPASYDGSMHRQDRALVDSLDQRAKHAMSTAPLTPIDEHTPSPLVARLEKISILPPMSMAHGGTAPAPASPGLSPRRDSWRAAEPTGRTGLPSTPARSPSYHAVNDTSPTSRRRSSALELRDQLRTWGHVYYGDAKTADAFVIARSLRRNNSTSPADREGAAVHDYRQGPPNTPTSPFPSRRLTVRAIVRPRALDRPSFLLQRNFDVDQLRATVPDPPRRDSVVQQRRSSGGLSERSPTSPQAHTQFYAQPRSRRSSSVQSGTLLRAGGGSIDLESLMRDAKAVPIHLKYARAYLPVVAALLTSGHLRDGDVVYLPMPHAEAWPQTARYVYTGQGELTDAVRDNILYLAGKV